MQETVKMFSLSTCSHCKATKRFLSECEVKYEFEDVDLLTIIIGEKVIVGFKEKEIKEALGL